MTLPVCLVDVKIKVWGHVGGCVSGAVAGLQWRKLRLRDAAVSPLPPGWSCTHWGQGSGQAGGPDHRGVQIPVKLPCCTPPLQAATQYTQKQPVLLKTSLLFQLRMKGGRRHLVVVAGDGRGRNLAQLRDAAWHCWGCHPAPVAWGCGRGGPRGPGCPAGQRLARQREGGPGQVLSLPHYTSVAGPHS